MALKYGDGVTLVQKARDGSLTRVQAIVLAMSEMTPTSADRKPLTDAAGEKLAPQPHVDLAFPRLGLAPHGQTLKTRDPEIIFQLAYAVAPWADGLWIGYEEPVKAPEPAAEPDDAAVLEALKALDESDVLTLPQGATGPQVERVPNGMLASEEEPEEPVTEPSAADLDAAAAEKAIAEATSGAAENALGSEKPEES